MSAPDRGRDRAAGDLLVGVLAGSTLLPFIQAMATKAGEDAYAKVRKRLSRRDRKRVKAELRATGTVTFVERDAHIVLQVPATTSATQFARLESVRLPIQRRAWVRVAWDPRTSQWLVQECPDPPPDIGIGGG